MSLDSFSGFSSAEPMSEAAFEAFKERMRAAAAQIAALRKQQAKQKKQEDQLVKILLQFIQSSTNTQLVLLISRCLEINIPANFILAIIQIISPEIGKMLNSNLLPESKKDASNQDMILFNEFDAAMPLRIRLILDNWLKNLLLQAEEYPTRLLKAAYIVNEDTKTIHPHLSQLTAYVIKAFLTEHKSDKNANDIEKFTEFIIKGILDGVSDGDRTHGLRNHNPML